MGLVMHLDTADPQAIRRSLMGLVAEGIVLEHHQRVEQVSKSRFCLDLRQPQMLVRQKCGLTGLQLLQEAADGCCRNRLCPYRHGVDEETCHGFDAGDLGRSAGDRRAEDQIIPSADAAKHDRPGALEHRVQGDVQRAGQAFQGPCCVLAQQIVKAQHRTAFT
ncbi:hypothetical protein LAL4801_06214 [Roseibium aggregatum]|uniref:Uncharacterized protein n=1 Tax=Roseibium aggregatum TaxID=187304 RepID=A0A0M6YCB6_9HYPH|nr:hypothetical protein LAL4801_06214 [Roseibium aggregatum]